LAKYLVTKAEFAALAGVSGPSITNACKTILKGAVVGRKIDANHPDALAYCDKHVKRRRGRDILATEAAGYLTGLGKWTMQALRDKYGVSRDRAAEILHELHDAGEAPPGFVPPKRNVKRAGRWGKKKAPDVAAAPPPAADGGARLKGHQARQAREKWERGAYAPDEVPEQLEPFLHMPLEKILAEFGNDIRFRDFMKAAKAIVDFEEKKLKNARAAGDLVARDLVKRGVIDPIEAAHLRLIQDGAKTISAGVVDRHLAGADSVELERYASEVISSFLRPLKRDLKKAVERFES